MNPTLKHWDRLGALPPGELADDRLQLHHAVQLLAAFGQSWLEPRDDDSHRSTTWDAEGRRFLTDPTPEGVRAGLVPETLTLVVVHDTEIETALALRGLTIEAAKEWLEGAVARARATATTPIDWPAYDLPEHPVAQGSPLEPTEAGLAELTRWFHDAALLLERLREDAGGASQVRCWPHHFDIASLITVVPASETEEGEGARTVGVGLSPGDPGSAAPYWYVNMWPYPDPSELPTRDGPGHWNREGWIGAVLSADELVAAGDGPAQAALAATFVNEIVQIGRKFLRG